MVTVTTSSKTETDITGIIAESTPYNGQPHQGYTGTPTSAYTGEYQFLYTGRNNTAYSSATAPTNAGDYTVTIKIPDTDNTYTGCISLNFTIAKAEQLAPNAPELESKTSNIVTLKAIAPNANGTAAEYSKDGGTTWQTSPTFTDLTANTEYSFVARYAETENYKSSLTSAVLKVTTDVVAAGEKAEQAAPAIPELESKTSNSISLKAIVPNANGTAAEYSKDGGTTWQTSPTFTALTANTEYSFVARYTETENYKASPVSVILKVTTDTVPVNEKAEQAAPATPELETKTSNSVTLKTIAPNANGAAAEYSKDGGTTWQTSPTFTALTANTEYSFVARYAEAENYKAYLGNAVNMRYSTKSYKDKRRIEHPREECLVFENTHPALVTQEIWDIVQRVRKNKRRRNNFDEQDKYSGLLVCADCGNTLVLHRSHGRDPSRYHFSCYTYKRKGADACTSHYIRECILDDVVLEDLRRVTAMAREHTREFAEYIGSRQSAEIQREIRRLERELTAMRKRSAELDAIIKKLYEDRVLEHITVEQFQMLSSGYIEEQSILEKGVAEKESAIQTLKESVSNTDRFIAKAKRYTDITELTPELLRLFIQKIVVHEKSVKYSKCAEQTVEIHYADIGFIGGTREEEKPRQEISA